MDTLGHLLTLTTSPANEQDRMQVEALCHNAQEITGGMLEVVFADQGYTGEHAHEAAHKSNIELIVVKRPDASRGFVLLPKRWVVERSLAWLSRFRRLGRDLERLSFDLDRLPLRRRLRSVTDQTQAHPWIGYLPASSDDHRSERQSPGSGSPDARHQLTGGQETARRTRRAR